MPSNSTTLNPFSTASSFAPGFRGSLNDSFQVSLPVTAAAAVSLPKIESYPATFVAVPNGARTLDTMGFMTAVDASTVVVHGATTGFSTSASSTADHVVISISSGVISITNASTAAATAAVTYSVTRIN